MRLSVAHSEKKLKRIVWYLFSGWKRKRQGRFMAIPETESGLSRFGYGHQ